MAEQPRRPRGDNLVVLDEGNDADQREVDELPDLGERTDAWPRSGRRGMPPPRPGRCPAASDMNMSGIAIV